MRFASRYLIERGIKGGCEIMGDAAPGERISSRLRQPDAVARPRSTIEPRVLSFDIETDPDASALLAISLYRAGASTRC